MKNKVCRVKADGTEEMLEVLGANCAHSLLLQLQTTPPKACVTFLESDENAVIQIQLCPICSALTMSFLTALVEGDLMTFKRDQSGH